MAEIKALKEEMATLKEEVKKSKEQYGAQGRNHAGVAGRGRRGCTKCQTEGCGDSCRHCLTCGDGGTYPKIAIRPRETSLSCYRGTDSSRKRK